MKQHDVIISGNHMELTAAIKNVVQEKVEKLFKHEETIIRIRVELSQNNEKEEPFQAKGHIEIKGEPLIVSESTDDLYKSIDQMVDKLDRKLRQRARLFRVKRKTFNSRLDIPAMIPKVA